MTASSRATHEMPFGAEVSADGRVRFRLWAPDAEQVELCLLGDEEETRLPMRREPDGWHETASERASGGTRYVYRIGGDLAVPDPASRSQPQGVHGPSEVIDASAYAWGQENWRGRPWREAVLYELHVGTFTQAGTFAAAAERCEYLADLGVTAIEIMPVAAFAGERNWGYDGVLPFAPFAGYGRPDDLRRLVDAAHAAGLMVLLDVVYNHFGPEGNYLNLYARSFFTARHRTPWGDAINYDGVDSRNVRAFFIHNALYWIEEFRLDGLRLDAVHAIKDDSDPDILEELAAAVDAGPGRERHVHLVLENVLNEAHRLDPSSAHPYRAQWNDDYHHACHVLLTGERDGYYADYLPRPEEHLARCLAEGYAYQGQISPFLGGRPRGEPSSGLPYGAFVDFLQNHDQVGNRAHGERLAALVAVAPLRAAVSLMLLSPATPGLFMGEEFGCRKPFLYFTDYEGELAAAVREGRRLEFTRFAAFGGEDAVVRIPDPNASETFERSKVGWEALDAPEHAAWLALYRELLALRRSRLVARLEGTVAERSETWGAGVVAVDWRLGDGALLGVVANLGERSWALPPSGLTLGPLLHHLGWPRLPSERSSALPPWSVVWHLREPDDRGRR